MAKIALRTYNREIEGMIDRGQVNLAIAHCRHILKYYPKHIDTYRLLGKAFLETQRYAESADILQRVLSTVPDDFISQIGMSIIREDEGNLDAAIWHMEKAFEAQPSNTAVQDELRRLHGRRDGVEPPKMRLTRGALVRMYSRGELYQQAIAEIRAALTEDPLRIDLEVILARMYYLSGQTVAAIEVCSRLVNKLPYCFEANRILAEVLPTTSRAEDAKIYQQRVFAMDPYLAYLPANAVSSAEVADNAVTLDQLELEAGEESAQLPEWAQTVGVDWKTDPEEEETLPDWFSTSKPDDEIAETPPDFSAAAVMGFQTAEEFESEAEHTVPSPGEPPLIDSIAEEEIPDWMKEAGWAPTETPDDTAQAGFNIPEDELEVGDIPEWLQEIAPEETVKTEAVEEQSEDTGWLEEILPQEQNSFAGDESESLQEDTTLSAPLVEEDDPLFLEQAPGVIPALADIDMPEPSQVFTSQAEDASAEDSLPFTEEGQNEWLKEFEDSQPFSEPAPSETNTSSEIVEDITLESALQPTEFESPHTGQETPREEMPDMNDLDATMAWLEALAARQGADEETLLTQPEERQITPPEWVQAFSEPLGTPDEREPYLAGALESELAEPALETQPEIQLEETPAPMEASPLLDVGIPTSEESETFAGAHTEDLPDWLVESLEEEDQSVNTFVNEIEKTESTAAPVESVEAPTVAEVTPISTPSIDEDSTFAWLESLAARQGVDEETLLIPPDQRQQELPDWLQVEAQLESEGAVDFIETAPLPGEDTKADENQTEAISFEPESAETAEKLEDTQPVKVTPIEPLIPQWTTEETIDQQEIQFATADGESQPESVAEWLQTLETEETRGEPPAPIEWVPEIETPSEEIPTPGVESLPPAEVMNSGDLLKSAQAALDDHNIERALHSYNQLIKNGDYLEETIHDLRDALYRYPIDITIWQTLGDAYLRSNRLQEALEAYTKAEELLR
ncbi:MAG: hypothetical protein ROW48_14595 [Bellilinea sp.]|jgi:tetratricopeptide (TPR) repeat protein